MRILLASALCLCLHSLRCETAGAIDVPYEKVATNGVTAVGEGKVFYPAFSGHDFEFRDGRIAYTSVDFGYGAFTYKDGSWSQIGNDPDILHIHRVSMNGDEFAFWGFNADSTIGVYRTDGPQTIAIAETVHWEGLGNPVLRDGRVAYFDESMPGGRSRALVINTAGSEEIVADQSMNVPGGLGTFGFSGDYLGSFPPLLRSAFDGTHVAFVAGNEHQAGIYSNVGGQLHAIADTNTPLPGGTGNFSDWFSEPTLANGQIAFRNGNGLYLHDGTSLTTLVDGGTLVPGVGEIRYLFDAGPPAFDDGRFAFFADYRPDESPESLARGLFADLGQGIQLIAREYEPIGDDLVRFIEGGGLGGSQYSQVRLDGNRLAFTTLETNGGLYVVTVPEPSTWAMTLIGMVGATLLCRRRNIRCRKRSTSPIPASLMALFIVIFALLTTPLQAATFSFTPLGDLPGGGYRSRAHAISADGSVVVGSGWSEASDFEAFLWTRNNGMTGLGDLAGGSFRSEATGVSANGSVIVGQGLSASGGEAFRWTSDTGMIGLGDLPGGIFSSEAAAISASGSMIVGRSWGAAQSEAFYWTEGAGMQSLGFLPNGIYSNATAVSASGDVIVGISSYASGEEAFRWTNDEGMVGLGDVAGGPLHSSARDVSADGSVIVGQGTSAFLSEAFRWSINEGFSGLGVLPGGSASQALAVSADGAAIVGNGDSMWAFEDALYWSENTGTVALRQFLIGHGVEGLDDWTLSRATGISSDGRTIVGWGTNPAGHEEAWVATVPEPSSLFLAILGAPAVLLWRRMRSIHRGQATASALLFAACISNQSYASEVPSLAEQGNLRVVAITGQQAPLDASGQLGSALFQNGGLFRSYEWGAPVINELGQTAFRASASWSDVLGSNIGIITEGGGTGLRLLARQNTPAPGTTWTFGPFLLNPTTVSYYSEPLISDAGTTALFAELSSGFSGIWSDRGGSELHLVDSSLVLHGANLPDAQSRLALYPVMDGAGHVYFQRNGVRTDAGGLHNVVNSGDQLPNQSDDELLGGISRPTANRSGEIAFVASIGDDRGIFTNAGGVLHAIARAGEQAIGFPEGASYQGFSRDAVINGQGRVSFQALVESPGELELKQGIWSDSSGQLQLIAAAGMTAPGVPGDLPFSSFGANGPLLGDGGHNVFVGEVASSPSELLSGLWMADSLGELAVVAFAGMAAPGTDAYFAGFGGHADPDGYLSPSRFPALNALGHVAFMAGLSSGDDYRDSLWVATTPNQLNLIVAEGDVLETSDGVLRTVAALDFVGNAGGGDGRRSGFNDAGQVAYYALFTDGYQGVFVTQVPEPSTWLLAACGGTLLSFVAWRQRRRYSRTR